MIRDQAEDRKGKWAYFLSTTGLPFIWSFEIVMDFVVVHYGCCVRLVVLVAAVIDD